MSFTLKIPYFHTFFRNFSKFAVFVLQIGHNLEEASKNDNGIECIEK